MSISIVSIAVIVSICICTDHEIYTVFIANQFHALMRTPCFFDSLFAENVYDSSIPFRTVVLYGKQLKLDSEENLGGKCILQSLMAGPGRGNL